jgi:hypothetical protein
LLSDESRESVDNVSSVVFSAAFIDLLYLGTKNVEYYFSDIELDGSGILGVDNLVGDGALSGDV